MSKDPRKRIETLGWTIVHEQDEVLEHVSGEEYRRRSARYLAESRNNIGVRLELSSAHDLDHLAGMVEAWAAEQPASEPDVSVSRGVGAAGPKDDTVSA